MLLPDYLYNWLLSLHIISVIAFMSGTMYLPRLFVYHVETKTGSEASERFKLMEKRLLKGIINPSLILTLILGILLATYPGVFNLNQIWVCRLGIIKLTKIIKLVF